MSHLSTVKEWIFNLTGDFNEARIAVTDSIKAHLAVYWHSVLTFVSNHSVELLFGSLSLVVGGMLAYLVYKLYEAQERSEELSSTLWRKQMDFFDLKHDYNVSQIQLADANETIADFEEQLSSMRAACAELEEKLENERESFEERLEDVQADRDYYENLRDEWREEANGFESQLYDAHERIETLEQMVDTYKNLVSELETTTQLKLAA